MAAKDNKETIIIRVLPGRAARALQEFFRLEAAGGILLILAAVVAMIMANSPGASLYEAFRSIPMQIRFADLDINKPLLLWINDGLMAIFFLLVALEIKREVLSGQLSSRAQLIQPLVCAIAGVAVPGLIYFAVNSGDAEAMRGWAIPAATDIAFALGVLSLLGSRAPIAMKLLLSTIAVLDDLMAIVIIAVFYTSELATGALIGAFVVLAAMFVLNRMKVRALTPYLLLGAVMWVLVLKSGVHATLAGVATGLMIPHVDRDNRISDEVAVFRAGAGAAGHHPRADPRQADRHRRRGAAGARHRPRPLRRQHELPRGAGTGHALRHRLHDEPVHRFPGVQASAASGRQQRAGCPARLVDFGGRGIHLAAPEPAGTAARTRAVGTGTLRARAPG
jgi:Na+/H+ antiporter NhaA